MLSFNTHRHNATFTFRERESLPPSHLPPSLFRKEKGEGHVNPKIVLWVGLDLQGGVGPSNSAFPRAAAITFSGPGLFPSLLLFHMALTLIGREFGSY